MKFRKLQSTKFLYEISENAIVRNVKSKKVTAQITDRYGYKIVNIYMSKEHKQRKVHQLMMEAFGPENPDPDKYTSIDHVDRNKSNNLIYNLRWATPSMQEDNKERVDLTPEHKENIKSAIKLRWANLTPDEKKAIYLHTRIQLPCMLEKDGEIHIFDSTRACREFLEVSNINNKARQGKCKIKGYNFSYLEKVERSSLRGVGEAQTSAETVEPD